MLVLDNDVDTSVYAAIKRTTAKAGYGVTDINCSTASKDRKVRVLHCDAEPLTTTSGIWLRFIGLMNLN